MKQLIQDFKSGELKVVDVPAPVVAPGCVLVRNAFSVVSAGTERATVALGGASLLGKARQRPDLVKQVLDTAKKEGVAATMRKVQSRLDEWKQLGYAAAGTVIAVGARVTGFAPGDRVACAGQDYASHAEVVCVPQNLCAKAPAGVLLEHAAFTTLGAIALHAVRQAQAQVGETVGVIGLGLIGQLTVRVLRAAGCRVVGADVRPEAVTLAGVSVGAAGTADAVIVTAATDSNAPVEQAAEWCRDRGRVVMVGVTGRELPRELFYRKELELRLSRSYGPGRYDPHYEEHGHDYPVGYVRWTEQRNMAAFLELLAAGAVDVAPLVTHTVPIADGARAYQIVREQQGAGVVLKYEEKSGVRSQESGMARTSVVGRPASVCLGVIGAGNYAQGVLLPLFQKQEDVTLHTVCTATGAKSQKAREKFRFAECTTDWRKVVAEPAINTVVVATRHNLHAEIVTAALQAGKTVFCEKPLCLTAGELAEILATGSDRLMVGFNRRFASWAEKVRAVPGPKVMRYRVSVQPLPAGHWVDDPAIGGGRILGELCHFVDFLQFATGAPPVRVFAQGLGANNVQVALRFADGSVGSIDYFEVAGPKLAKEYLEVFGSGRYVVVDEFRDKGQAEEVRQFVAASKGGGPMPIPFAEIVTSTRATFAVIESLQTGQAVEM